MVSARFEARSGGVQCWWAKIEVDGPNLAAADFLFYIMPNNFNHAIGESKKEIDFVLCGRFKFFSKKQKIKVEDSNGLIEGMGWDCDISPLVKEGGQER